MGIAFTAVRMAGSAARAEQRAMVRNQPTAEQVRKAQEQIGVRRPLPPLVHRVPSRRRRQVRRTAVIQLIWAISVTCAAIFAGGILADTLSNPVSVASGGISQPGASTGVGVGMIVIALLWFLAGGIPLILSVVRFRSLAR